MIKSICKGYSLIKYSVFSQTKLCQGLKIIFVNTKLVLLINFRNSELTPDNNAVDILFKFLASKENDTVRPRVINILGRNVKFSKSCGRILDTTFTELCDRVSIQEFRNIAFN